MALLESPTTLRLLQALGLTTSIVLTTFNLTLSLNTVPTILTSSPSTLLPQWRRVYTTGKAFARPSALVVALSYLCLSYLHRRSPLLFLNTTSSLTGVNGLDWKSARYIIGAMLTLGIVPYTAFIMGETNNELLFRGEMETVDGEGRVGEMGTGGKSVKQLVDEWGLLNLGRGGMLALGSFVGIWNVLF